MTAGGTPGLLCKADSLPADYLHLPGKAQGIQAECIRQDHITACKNIIFVQTENLFRMSEIPALRCFTRAEPGLLKKAPRTAVKKHPVFAKLLKYTHFSISL